MSLVVERGFALRDSQWTGSRSAHPTVEAALQLVVNCLEMMLVLPDCAEAASRSPELDSHAIAPSSWSGFCAFGVISVNDPKLEPSQIYAFTSELVVSPPRRPI